MRGSFSFIFLIIPLLNACMFNAKIENLKSENSSNATTLFKPDAKFSVQTVSYDESVGNVDVFIELSEESSKDISLYFSIEGTASGNAVDYSLPSPGPISILKGSKTGKIQLNIIDDGIGDAGETIILRLQEDDSVIITEPSAVITLTETIPPVVVSNNKIVDNTTFSYVDMDVDWSRNLAYLATRKANKCIDVVDFSNPLVPSIVKSIGSGTLQTCLGVRLFDGNKKVLASSLGSSKIAAWDLTSNPFDFVSWYQLGEYAIGSQGKRVAGIKNTGVNTWEVYSTKSSGVFKASLSISGAVGTFALLNSYNTGLSFNASTVIGNTVLAQSFTGTTEPVSILNLSLVAQTTSTTSFWGWTANTNEDGSKSFLGGGTGGAAFFADDSGTVNLKKKFLLNSTCTVRSADFAIQGSKEYLYSLCSNGSIDVFDVTDINNPVLVKVGQINLVELEAYAIKVKANSNTGIVVTNKGDFIVINLLGLTSPSAQYPVDP